MKLKLRKKTPPKSDDTQRESLRGKVSRPEAYNYHARRYQSERGNDRGHPRPAPKSGDSLGRRLERLTSTILIGVLVFSFLYLFWLDMSPRVRLADNPTATEPRGLLREPAEYEAGIRDILDDTPLSRSKLTINTERMQEKILQRYPELASVTITLPLTGQRPIIDIRPRESALLLNSRVGGTYTVDRSGTIMGDVSEIPQSERSHIESLPLVEDNSGVEARPGQQIVTSETVNFLLQLTHQYRQAEAPIRDITFPRDKPNEIRVTDSGNEFFVKYIVTRTAAEQFGAYRAVLERTGGEGVEEYVDVRVPGKAFYK
ncbi:MAG: hypothetical protein U5L95_03795 [Candidatus Saccharibacteria bacterium]|nr:hypothetical protein [Candidatus Saccharibacteria bacterium]